MHTKFRWDISTHGWDKTTSGFGNGNTPYCTSGFDFDLYVVIGMSFCIHLPNLVAIWRLALYRFFEVAAIKSEIYFRVQLSYRHLFKKVATYSHAKFRWDISKIKLLQVSEKTRPPYWNCTSGFDFELGLLIVIGGSLCISLSNFVMIGISAAKLWHYIDFLRWRS